MIDSDSYWHAKDSWGESSLKFDQSCGIKFSKENISWRELRYLPFFIIDEKKFNYAYIKYDFILKI
jgi:hypothetical protein